MDRDSCARLGILDTLGPIFREQAQAYARIPTPIAPCSDDEVDPTTPARPVSQRDED
jgi:hypothetical protein